MGPTGDCSVVGLGRLRAPRGELPDLGEKHASRHDDGCADRNVLRDLLPVEVLRGLFDDISLGHCVSNLWVGSFR